MQATGTLGRSTIGLGDLRGDGARRREVLNWLRLHPGWFRQSIS
jgi:hypothetical protein